MAKTKDWRGPWAARVPIVTPAGRLYVLTLAEAAAWCESMWSQATALAELAIVRGKTGRRLRDRKPSLVLYMGEWRVTAPEADTQINHLPTVQNGDPEAEDVRDAIGYGVPAFWLNGHARWWSEVRQQVAARLARIARPNDGRHYRALVAESERVGWPLRYAADLTVHDRASLARTPHAEPFCWALGPSGTVLYFPERAGAWGPADFIRTMRQDGERRIYRWDGVSLASVEPSGDDRLVDWLARAERAAHGGSSGEV